MQELLQSMPAAKWVSWEPVSRDNTRAGAVLAFGEPVEPQYRFDQADVILSLEADFVSGHPASLRLVREFASRRKAGSDLRAMNRLYVAEGSPSLSGASADHRLALRSSAIEGFARAVAAGCGLAVEGAVAHEWVGPIVKDLKRAGSKGLVLAGESQPAAVHALAHAINEALGRWARPSATRRRPRPSRAARRLRSKRSSRRCSGARSRCWWCSARIPSTRRPPT
jgi:molybdopterin-containing oxidoreductase family iron-sulfur binding subunit